MLGFKMEQELDLPHWIAPFKTPATVGVNSTKSKGELPSG